MAKLTGVFFGVPDGGIYPVQYAAGDDCPPELEAGAESLGVLGTADGGDLTVPELKAALDAKGVSYPASAKKSDLQALLAAE